MNKRNHILVTGGAGFIGSTLVLKLLVSSKVTVIDNFNDFYDPSRKRKNIHSFLNNSKFKLIEGDILNLESLENEIEKDIDAIIHIAAKAGVRPSIEDPVGYEKTNVIGTINLLEFAKKRQINQFVFASSSSVYGVNENVPWIESLQLNEIISPYAATKKTGEIYGKMYSELYGIRFIALRLFTVYGPKQRPDLAIHKFVKKIMNNEQIEIYGKGDTYRDYTFVEDIVDGFVAALNYEKSLFEIFNLGNNTPISIIDLVNLIGKVMDIKPEIKYCDYQAGDVPKTYANIDKAKEKLGYSPKTDMENGLKKFYSWMQNEE